MKAFTYLLGMFVLLLGFSPQSVAAPPKVDCVLSADRATYHINQTAHLSVRIINKSAHDVYLLGSLDGSEEGRRFPKWRVEVLDAAGKPVNMKRGGAWCGNMNTLRPDDFVLVPRGGSFNPFGQGFFGADGFEFLHVQRPGRYRVRFVYSTASDAIRDYFGDERMRSQFQPSPDIMHLFRQVPKVELRSNELRLEFTAPNAKVQN